MNNKNENEKILKNIFSKIFKISITKISDKISVQTIKKWDSLNHLRLILEIERRFNISFSHELVPKLQSFKIIKLKLKEKKIKF